MTLAERIEAALLRIIKSEIPDVADGGLNQITQSDSTKHWLLDPAWIVTDEIDLTKLSELLADAITVKVDPAEPKAGED